MPRFSESVANIKKKQQPILQGERENHTANADILPHPLNSRWSRDCDVSSVLVQILFLFELTS